MIFSSMVENSIPKTKLGTTVKLNGSNYLLGAHVFRIFIDAQNKLIHLLQAPLATTNPPYMTCLTGDYFVMTWLFTRLEEKISVSIIFLTAANEM